MLILRGIYHQQGDNQRTTVFTLAFYEPHRAGKLLIIVPNFVLSFNNDAYHPKKLILLDVVTPYTYLQVDYLHVINLLL